MWIVFLAEALAAGLPGTAADLPRDAVLMHGVYFCALLAAAAWSFYRPDTLRPHGWKFHVLAVVVFVFEAVRRLESGLDDPLGLAFAVACAAAAALAGLSWTRARRCA